MVLVEVLVRLKIVSVVTMRVVTSVCTGGLEQTYEVVLILWHLWTWPYLTPTAVLISVSLDSAVACPLQHDDVVIENLAVPVEEPRRVW